MNKILYIAGESINPDHVIWLSDVFTYSHIIGGYGRHHFNVKLLRDKPIDLRSVEISLTFNTALEAYACHAILNSMVVSRAHVNWARTY